MFEFSWPINLRYCSYDTAPLRNREMLELILLESEVDTGRLAELLGECESVVEAWSDGSVRPRFSDLDRVAEVCEYDVGPGFGQLYGEALREQRAGTSGYDDEGYFTGQHRSYDPDPEGHDRADMRAAGWLEMHMPPHWEIGYPELQADVTAGRRKRQTSLENDCYVGSKTATIPIWTPSSPKRICATTSARSSAAPKGVSI